MFKQRRANSCRCKRAIKETHLDDPFGVQPEVKVSKNKVGDLLIPLVCDPGERRGHVSTGGAHDRTGKHSSIFQRHLHHLPTVTSDPQPVSSCGPQRHLVVFGPASPSLRPERASKIYTSSHQRPLLKQKWDKGKTPSIPF